MFLIETSKVPCACPLCKQAVFYVTAAIENVPYVLYFGRDLCLSKVWP